MKKGHITPHHIPRYRLPLLHPTAVAYGTVSLVYNRVTYSIIRTVGQIDYKGFLAFDTLGAI